MMNYAWANPSTGFREQTEKHWDPRVMLIEARYRVWQELQGLDPVDFGDDEDGICSIWQQDPVGSVTVNGPQVDEVLAKKSTQEGGDLAFAWADPETGRRIVSESFPGSELVDVLKRFQANNDAINEVIVYATWKECVVHRSDPEPDSPDAVFPAPAALRGDPARPPSRIDQQRAILDTVETYDAPEYDATKIGKISAWALLDIAERLSLLVDGQQSPKHPKRRLGLWERFKLWVMGTPKESDMGSCAICAGPTAGETSLICPRCAGEIVGQNFLCCGPANPMPDTPVPSGFATRADYERWEGETNAQEQAAKRAQTVASRGPLPVDFNAPHVYEFQEGGDACGICHRPEKHAIHGYTDNDGHFC